MDYYAFAFQSNLTLADMLRALAELGFGQWQERFKDSWGTYLFGRLNPAPYNAVAKLITENERFVVNIKLRPEQPGGEGEFQAVRDKLLGEVLPALGAQNVTGTEYIE